MNQHLIRHVDEWLDKAASFVCRFMPVDITVDTAYEELLACTTLSTNDMITAFHNAVQYLEPKAHFKRFSVMQDDRIITIDTRFTPTAKWPTFLIPAQNLVLDPEGKFAALLHTPIRVATEWTHLEYVWQQLRMDQHALTNEQLVYLMPWLRECLADFSTTIPPSEMKIPERKAIYKEHAAIMHNDANVLFFPRLSKDLMAVARSGRVLISQYRMIEAAYTSETLTQPPVTVERAPNLIETWVKEHFTEAMEEWRQDRNNRAARELAKLRARIDAGKFDTKLPRG